MHARRVRSPEQAQPTRMFGVPRLRGGEAHALCSPPEGGTPKRMPAHKLTVMDSSEHDYDYE
jgi:hypothetical protein